MVRVSNKWCTFSKLRKYVKWRKNLSHLLNRDSTNNIQLSKGLNKRSEYLFIFYLLIYLYEKFYASTWVVKVTRLRLGVKYLRYSSYSAQPYLALINSRAPIDRPISQESSASPDLVDDRAAHPVCDHKRSEQRHSAVVWIHLAPHLSDSQVAVIWAA